MKNLLNNYQELNKIYLIVLWDHGFAFFLSIKSQPRVQGNREPEIYISNFTECDVKVTS